MTSFIVQKSTFENMKRFFCHSSRKSLSFRPKAAIFDLDGTLLDSEIVYDQATFIVCEKYGKKCPTEKLRPMVIGKPTSVGCDIIVNEVGLPISGKEFQIERDDITQELFTKCELKPGAQKLIEKLLTLDIPLAIATSSLEKCLQQKLKSNPEFFKYFSPIIHGQDLRLKGKLKPNPDIYLLVSELINVDPKFCVAFEDSPSGVLSAHRANMTVIAIPEKDHHTQKFTFSEENFKIADFKISQLDEFIDVL